ncbi:MAG: glycosyltransferase family 4 protein [Ignavibacteria bacterium]|nr:glycosyltransferase family 4 protein [Ignavibacteria bacterium]
MEEAKEFMHDRATFSRNHDIAFICFSSSFGGLELTTVRLARDFGQRMANCTLVVPAGTPLAAQAAAHALHVEYLEPGLKYGDILASRRLARILKSLRVDVAVVMQSKDINVVTAAKLAYPALKIVFYQQMQSGVSKRDFLHTWMFKKLSLWISLTARMKQDVIEHTRMPEELVRVIPLGRDTDLFDPQMYDSSNARGGFDLPSGRPIIGMLGRLDPQKGQEEFLRSVPLVLKQRSDAYFLIAGEETDGEEGFRRHLVDLTHHLGVSDHIRFLPFTNDVPQFMSAIDIFVLPSYAETYGLVLIEAMAMEKPVIATSAGGVPEIVEHGRTGLLVPPRDHEALADAMVTLLRNPELRASLSKQARAQVLERFDSSRCLDHLVASLDAL